jgi:predicted SAM-dependent methyltransferase
LATEHIFTTNRGGFNSSVVPFDVVTAIHLLEHLQPQQTETAIANLWKITGRRLIISVPLEEKPDKQFGHQQVFDQQRLSAIAQQLSTSYRYFENRGGWIVIDRPATLTQNPPKRRYHHAKVPY